MAERGHLTGRAKALHLTPSADTAAIQALEGRHGTKLFHRVGRRLEPSEGGRALLVQARTVLGAAKAAETALQEIGGLARGRLTLAASQTLASHWQPPLLTRFSEPDRGRRCFRLGFSSIRTDRIRDGLARFGRAVG